MTSDFLDSVNAICVLVGFYAGYNGSSRRTFREKLLGPFEGSSNSDCLSLEMAAIQCVAPKSQQDTIPRSYVQTTVLNVTNIGKYENIFSVGHLGYTV